MCTFVMTAGPADLRVAQRCGKEYNEYGFCMTAPHDGSMTRKAEFIQKLSRANAVAVERQRNNLENQWESFLACTNAQELPHHAELKDLIRHGIPYQYKGKVGI